jgi:hypothetical protein
LLVKLVTAPWELVLLASRSRPIGGARENRQQLRVRTPVKSVGVTPAVQARDGNRADPGVLTHFATTIASRRVTRLEPLGR